MKKSRNCKTRQNRADVRAVKAARAAARRARLDVKAQDAISHLVGLGYADQVARDIVDMDCATSIEQREHYAYILECDAERVHAWIGVAIGGAD